MHPTPDQVRRLQQRRVHMLARQLHMDSETRHALQLRVTGKASTSDMTLVQLGAVVSELNRLAGDDQAPAFDVHKDEPKDLASRPMLRKVGAILADGKLPWSYAHATAERMFKVTRVEWLKDPDLHRLIAALSFHQRRGRKKAASR